MSKQKILVFFQLIIFFAFSGLRSQVTTSNPIPDSVGGVPEMKMDKLVHDYGTIVQNADGTCEFKFTNIGKAPLIISKCQASCNCTVPTCSTKSVLPNESDVIKILYGTSRVGTINKQITIYSNAINSPIVLNIKGNVIEKISEQK